VRKARICLLHTGGTIGMIEDTNGILTPPQTPTDLRKLVPELEQVADIDFVPLFNKDSTNIFPCDWTTMAHNVFQRRNRGYDGFVISHGTDTMHFSASALSFALGKNLPFPVVFTGAMAIPSVLYGDARTNLVRAIYTALSNLSEVVIAFGNRIFRGCRTQKKDYPCSAPFYSPMLPPLGEFSPEIILRGHAKSRPKSEIPSPDIDLRPDFASGVLPIPMVPGLEPQLIEPIMESDTCKGLVIQAFGAGNIPNRQPYPFNHLVQQATQLGKPVLITTPFISGSPYGPGFEAVQAGAIPTGNMTFAAATVKLRWVLAEVEKKLGGTHFTPAEKIRLVREKMVTPYVLEMGR